MKLILATRGSKLALTQSTQFKDAVEALPGTITVELKVIQTSGDRIQNVPLSEVGGKGLFTQELEDALLDGSVDFAVHSMKDVPTVLPSGLCVACIPKREDPRDVLIHRTVHRWEDLPDGLCVGTSSLRRVSQLKALRPDMRTLPLRGNVDTRLRKLDEGQVDAIILAAAGLKRLGFMEQHSIFLEPDVMIPAVGQGALCIEAAEKNSEALDILKQLHDPDTAVCVALERAGLKRLEGSCQIPIGIHAQIHNNHIHARACIASLNGETLIHTNTAGPPEHAEQLGIQLAETLLERGGEEILEAIRSA